MATQVGRIVLFSEIESGMGRNAPWEKQTMVIEYGDQYPKEAAFTLWNSTIGDAERYNVGDLMEVHFSPESREYNGKWYTENKCFKLLPYVPGGQQAQPRQQRQQAAPAPAPAHDQHTNPYANRTAPPPTPRQQMAAQPNPFVGMSEPDNDLPF
nr:DUF3127 domain-containing protein [uncultured Arsenicibacter sp.]